MPALFKSFMIVGWLLFVLPMLGFGSCAVVVQKTDSFGTGMFVSIFPCIFASVIFFRIYGSFAKRAANTIVDSVASKHGLNDGYFFYNDMSNRGFIIDSTQ